MNLEGASIRLKAMTMEWGFSIEPLYLARALDLLVCLASIGLNLDRKR